jgi:ferredoxin-NADP reductase
MNSPTADHTLSIIDRDTSIGDVVVLTLANQDSRPLPGWQPGDHIDLLLPQDLVRQYSLCGPADAATWRLAILREADGRGGSRWVADQLAVGDTIATAGPRSTFSFEPAADRPVLLLAGGIGITPLLPMASHARRLGLDYTLCYAGHSGHMAFVDELAAEHGESLRTFVSETNRLDLDSLFASLAADTQIYCCGPLRLIDAAEDLARARELEFRAERFEAEPLTAPVWNEPFDVELELTGVTITVPPDRSILDVAEENGAFVLSSCQEGTCGTCETVVVEGEIDHRDSILTPAERERNDKMYICVSRAACAKITLDL